MTKHNARSKLNIKCRRHLYTLIRRFSPQTYHYHLVLGYDQRSAGVLATANRLHATTVEHHSQTIKTRPSKRGKRNICQTRCNDRGGAGESCCDSVRTAGACSAPTRRPPVKLKCRLRKTKNFDNRGGESALGLEWMMDSQVGYIILQYGSDDILRAVFCNFMGIECTMRFVHFSS